MNSLEVVLLGFVVVMSIFAASLAWKLFKGGTPRDQLARQVAVKGADTLDAIADRVIAALARETEKLNNARGLKDQYFDRDELIADLARLPAGGAFKSTVRLDGMVKREGVGDPVDYVTAQNGNVLRK